MDKQKADAYKVLVAKMQKKYPVYGTNFVSKLPGTKSIAKDKSKKIARDFCGKFSDIQEFYKLLEEWGLDWTKTNNENITKMWAINSLANAIEDGFDFERASEKNSGAVKLWAPVADGEIICKEINLYTYWQGFGYAEKTPKIKYLLVAQDWGNFFNDENFISQMKKINGGDKTANYFCTKPLYTTDKNLAELFKVLGYENIMTQRYDDLFFTNFCLGYRSGKSQSDMTKKTMMNDAEEFKKLCEILEPENILCLGKMTSECVVQALKNLDLKKAYENAKNYNEFLDNQSQLVLNYGEHDEIFSNVYPLAHCGVFGIRYRSLEKQKEDWKRIIEEKKIDVAIENFCREDTIENKNRVLKEIFLRAEKNDSFIIAQQNFGDGNFLDDVIPIFKNIKSVFLKSKRDGKYFLAAFTTLLEFAKFNESSGRKFDFVYIPAEKFLNDCLKDDIGNSEGIILNPASENNFRLTQKMVKEFCSSDEKEIVSNDEIDNFDLIKSWLKTDLKNQSLEKKIAEYKKVSSEKNFQGIKDEIFRMLQENNPSKGNLIGFFCVLTENKINGQVTWQPNTFEKDEKVYDVLFTNVHEVTKHKYDSENSQVVVSDITEIFRVFAEVYLEEELYGGLAINPYGENSFFLDKDDMTEILAGVYYSDEDNFLEMTKNIESAVNKFELNDNIIVYRRANISLLNYFEKILQSGGIFQDDGFISTTALKIGSNENEIEISVIVPKGKGYGAYIAPLSEFPDECEFLLNCGTLFKVREVDKKNFKVVIEAVGRALKELD